MRKASKHIITERRKEALLKAQAKALELRKTCPYCYKSITIGGFQQHTKACYLSPQNRKDCPVCGSAIKNYKYTETCSYGCANTLFRSGKNHPNWKDESYRSSCFLQHKKECVVCGENLIVEVHHLNEDSSDNRIENLIPLCPTHHQYWHSRHRHLIEQIVYTYVLSFFFEREAT